MKNLLFRGRSPALGASGCLLSSSSCCLASVERGIDATRVCADRGMAGVSQEGGRGVGALSQGCKGEWEGLTNSRSASEALTLARAPSSCNKLDTAPGWPSSPNDLPPRKASATLVPTPLPWVDAPSLLTALAELSEFALD